MSSVSKKKCVIILIKSLERKVQDKRNKVEIRIIFRGEITLGWNKQKGKNPSALVHWCCYSGGTFPGIQSCFFILTQTSGKGCRLHVTIPTWSPPPWMSIYVLIHLPGAACVRQGMKMLDEGGCEPAPPSNTFYLLLNLWSICT